MPSEDLHAIAEPNPEQESHDSARRPKPPPASEVGKVGSSVIIASPASARLSKEEVICNKIHLLFS